jgi:trehalose 6-phosphate synthase/phosphatase
MRLLIVSNRAPVNIQVTDKGFKYSQSSGGLVSGLTSYIEKLKAENRKSELLWIGWPGAEVKDEDMQQYIFENYDTHSIFLPQDISQKFYEGFCNSTIWPLFHYFPQYTNFDQSNWENYIDVNERFCNEIIKLYNEGDVIWIHDYHLMLLPAMLRERLPEATIGFFLHIPFPSYEIFRLLPTEWRMNIIKGIFGADLIGFHTHDYRTHFLRSALSILGLSNNMGTVEYFGRTIKVDSFPMSIDYDKFNCAVQTKSVQQEISLLKQRYQSKCMILSIDRQDYSKGILNRLRGFEYFLKTYPEYSSQVMLVMVVIPSRTEVGDYAEIKSQIDQIVGRINGDHGTFQQMPVLYQYRSLSFDELIALYATCEVCLVTPLRDGMNLVAKEFIACKTNGKGVLILSEMAGAAEELTEALIINPNNIEEIGNAIKDALELSEEEQRTRLKTMQSWLKENDIFCWAEQFLSSLASQKDKQRRMAARILPDEVRKKILCSYKTAGTKTLFLDYDGTLQKFSKTPEQAMPSASLIALLDQLSSSDKTELIVISGRDWQTMENWFGKLNVGLIAEHGMFLKKQKSVWTLLKPVRKFWKKKIYSIMESYLPRLPGALIEQKDYSIAFHYRRCDTELAALRTRELMKHLMSFTDNLDVQIVRGNKVIEVRCAGVDKGVAALKWLSMSDNKTDFILAIGDDVTDEDLFRVIPQNGFSIKVGRGSSFAMYNLPSPDQVIDLLREIARQ